MLVFLATSGPPTLVERNRRMMLALVRRNVEDLPWQPLGDPEPIALGLTARPELVDAHRFCLEITGTLVPGDHGGKTPAEKSHK
ncbi:MAG: hypothetical protein ACRDYX_18875 [Egibacteraceae bacterium]